MTPEQAKLPRNITVSSAFLPPIENDVKNLFANVLADYLERFNLKLNPGKFHVAFAGMAGAPRSLDRSMGFTITTPDRILVLVRDPSLDEDFSEHFYTSWAFLNILCHEMVHVCQALTCNTKREYTRVPQDTKNADESYFFDPEEVEARVLEGYYLTVYASHLLDLMKDLPYGKTIRLGD